MHIAPKFYKLVQPGDSKSPGERRIYERKPYVLTRLRKSACKTGESFGWMVPRGLRAF